MEGQEWVVQYWTPEKKERRFRTENEAMRFIIMLPPRAKVYVDTVNFGEEVVVR
jgi:hypothetical protein